MSYLVFLNPSDFLGSKIGLIMIENIEFNNKLLSVIIRSTYKKDGIEFFTPSHFSQQLGYMSHPQGHVIKPHVHNPVIRQVEYTKEVLFIKKGIVRVDFYDDHKNYMINLTQK